MSNGERFIELYSFDQKKYSEIKEELGISIEDVRAYYDETREETLRIQTIRNKFTGKRKDEFEDFRDFYNWYSEVKQECGYCGITQAELQYIFQEEQILPLNDAFKRSKGTLEIERKDSVDNSYGKDNIILACPLCNNAKSNLIDEASWRGIFVKPMRKYYEKLLGRELTNKIPE